MSSSKLTLIVITAILFASATLTPTASAAVLPQLTLINGTADISQGSLTPDGSVDGSYNDVTGESISGWAIDPGEGSNHVAAWNISPEPAAIAI